MAVKVSMIAVLRQALTSPLTGPIATAVACALAVALGLAANDWEARRARYEARIVELTAASQRAEASLKTELASCQAAAAAREQTAATYAAQARTPEGARRLLEQHPEGIDACARMEAADQAVLSNLKK
jgi:hypothetical protein